MTDHDPDLAHVTPELRDKLLTELLLLAERFNREHGLGLDLPGRMGLYSEVLGDYYDAIMASLGSDPVH